MPARTYIFLCLLSICHLYADETKKATDKAGRDTLLQTEEEFIVELLQMEKLKLAQQHLDIIKKNYPDRKQLIHNYQGRISMALKDYKSAINNFEALLKFQLTEPEKAQIYRQLFLANARVLDLKKATDYLNKIDADIEKYDWYAGACLDLARTITVNDQDKPAAERIKIFADCARLLGAFVEKYPKHERIDWFHYYLAEHEKDKLDLLIERSNLEEEGSDLARQKKLKAIAKQLAETRQKFKLCEGYTKSRVAILADARLKGLDELAKKLFE